MSISEYWRALRWFLAGWLIVNLLGFVSIGSYLFKHSEASNELIALQQKLSSIRQQVTQKTSYQPDVAFYLSRRARWQQQGISQAANPDHWITAWLALQQKWHLPHMQYDIQSSVTCTAAACDQFWPGHALSGLSMTVTPVKMRWSVSHEKDVLDWLQHLQHLQQMHAGMLLVHGCTWVMKESAGIIEAQCELHLFNFPNMSPASLSAT
jgi:hypothetical protein